MTDLQVQAIEKKFINKKMPVLRPGYQVRVHQKIKEGNKERIQVFEGIVIGVKGSHGSNKTVIVRKVVQGVGVEKTFPVNSPNISKIDVKKTFGVRRAKLYFLRSAEVAKRLRAKLGLTEKDEKHKEAKGLNAVKEAPKTEEAKAEETPKEEAVKAEEPVKKEEAAEKVEAPAQPEKEEKKTE
jgi:large subunit ribosomal protein L19